MKLFYFIVSVLIFGLFACSNSPSRTMAEDQPVTTAQNIQAQEEQGTVKKFLMNSRGELDGLLLEGGIQVNFQPVIATRIKKVIAVNDVVLVKGYYENDRVFRAEDIKNVRTSRRVSEQLSVPPAPLQEDFPNYLPPEGTHSKISKTPMPSHHGLKKISAQGTVETRLYGKFGELNGVILSDGTIIHFKPDILNTMDLNAEIGDHLKASGYGIQNDFGRSIDAIEVIRQ